MVNALTRPYYVVRRRVIRYRDRRRIDRLLLTVAAESPPSEEEAVAPETDPEPRSANPEPRPAAPTPRRMRRMGSPRRLDYLLQKEGVIAPREAQKREGRRRDNKKEVRCLGGIFKIQVQ